MSGNFVPGERFPKVVENRIKEWQDSAKHEPAHLSGGTEIDYITISREVGSGGAEVAKILSELMGWGHYDKKILDFMAENFGVHQDVLQTVDEKTRGWIQDTMSIFFSGKSSRHMDQYSYYKHLVEALLVIAKHGRAIIVGRGAGHVLPRKRGLSVRVTAPFELRSQRYARENNISSEKAIIEVKKADKEQQKFIKSFLYKDAFDAKYFDLVCNTEKLAPRAVAKLIWRAFDLRVSGEQEDQE
ncbi:MAG: cytidylate kinase-like family protein [Phycisphaerae bacterium]|nr:cytidylate kinase-like family protein [Phycisphaerae bacterium]